MVVDNPNILVLARKLEQMPHVLQVRFWTPLKPEGKQTAGPGGMIFLCLTRDFTDPNNVHIFQNIIPAVVINTEEHHQSVVDSVSPIIEHYFQTGEYPHGTNWAEKGPSTWEPEEPSPEETPQNP
jgi:hypothetical protein